MSVPVFQLTGQIKSQVAEKIEVVKQHSGEDGSLLGHVRLNGLTCYVPTSNWERLQF